MDEEGKFAADFGGSSNGFSLHEALWQCQSMFSDVKGKMGQKKIILLTCVDDPHADSTQKKRQVMQKATDLHSTGVYLDVFPIGRGFRLDKFFKDLVQLADDENPLDKADPAERLDDLLRIVRKRIYKKRSIGRTFLTLGPGVKLSISTYNLVQKASKPTKVNLARDTNEEVKTNRAFINHETGAELLPSEINKFQEYGGKRIKFSLDECKGMMSMQTETGLKLLGENIKKVKQIVLTFNYFFVNRFQTRDLFKVGPLCALELLHLPGRGDHQGLPPALCRASYQVPREEGHGPLPL
jgi:ATP-dependent DNA helicase II